MNDRGNAMGWLAGEWIRAARRLVCGLVACGCMVGGLTATAATPQDWGEADAVLGARIAALTPPVGKVAANELKWLTSARTKLGAYDGGADKADLKLLSDVVKALTSAASPDADVRAIFGLVKDQHVRLAETERALALVEVARVAADRSRAALMASIASGDAALAAAATAWATSPSTGVKGQAKAIGIYQKARMDAAKVLAKEPNSGGIRYAGVLPVPGLVTFQDGGQNLTVQAYPGQVMVMFDGLVPATAARTMISGAGGTVIAQIPRMGVFLAAVTPGQEGAFIAEVSGKEGVFMAIPHLVTYRMGASVTVIDDCGGSHGNGVSKVLTDRGVAIGECRSDGGSRPSPILTEWELEQEVFEGKTGPSLINISSSAGFAEPVYYESQPESNRERVLKEYTMNLRSLLKAISQLPLIYRQNLVVTLCAGNHHIPLDPVLLAIGSDPVLAAILRDNILIVGSKGQAFSNYPQLMKDDFAWVANPESADGTSYAAPYALALISKIMEQRGVSAKEALQLVKESVAANPDHQLVEAAVLGNGSGAFSGTVSGQTTDTLDGNVWRATFALDLVVTVSGSGTLGDPFQVSMGFAGNLTETLLNCPNPGEAGCDPGGTYQISGTGDGTSLGKVSVTALLGGSDEGFTVRLSDGVVSPDKTKLTATVTVDSVGFDAPVVKTVVLPMLP